MMAMDTNRIASCMDAEHEMEITVIGPNGRVIHAWRSRGAPSYAHLGNGATGQQQDRRSARRTRLFGERGQLLDIEQ
jgi:hypothetical protein